ncbi:MAG: amidohydrolase family protein, partial [Bryobacterales bacterium]|nr:amidohydrolase family protein [Bryobacterales bacterium]
MKPILGAALFCSVALAQSPTLLFTNGKIWTGNPQQKEAEAVAIAGNRIVAVGGNADILKLKVDSTTVIDLGGRRTLPGFNDAHVHFYDGGLNLSGPQLRHASSQAEFRDTLAAFSKHVPRGQWITGGNWDHENWKPAVLPVHQLIDEATSDWPVFVNRLDGHMSLANATTLKLAGIDKNTKDVPGGVIVRDAEDNPTGILKDAA